MEYNSAEELERSDRSLIGLEGVTWENQPVTARNTNYTFDQLKNTSYYIFYVGHRPRKLKNTSAKRYSSSAKFFGRQSKFLEQST